MKAGIATVTDYSVRVLCICTILAVIFCIPTDSSAQDFSASVTGNYGDVTVMEVTGSYDTDIPEAYTRRTEITKEFFRTHPDNYDFLVIFSGFDYEMPIVQVAGENETATAYYIHVRNDVQGIGLQNFDYSESYGSSGKLQGFIEAGYLSNIVSEPLDPEFETTMTTLSHELMHRWSCFVKYRKDDGTITDDLLGAKDLTEDRRSHWSFLLDTSGSVMYGNRWHDNKNGTFTSSAGKKYYSPLDLYLMGINSKSEVPPMLLIENPETDRERMPETGTTIQGIPHYVTIEDIIAAEGERIPSSAESQKDFKIGVILLARPGTYTEDELYKIRSIIREWTMRFSSLTDGKAIIRADANPLENIPTNPGISELPHDPRTLPPEINDGVAWLMDNQNTDGTWLDTSQTLEKDTAEAVAALENFPTAEQNHINGVQSLAKITHVNTDYLSRQIIALSGSEEDITGLAEELVSRQNPDGGWGTDMHYTSSAADTSFALKALAAIDYSDPNITEPAVDYMIKEQHPDGSWGSNDGSGSILTTANTLFAFSRYRETYELEQTCQNGFLWLLGKQNTDGGFGCSPSTVYETAEAVSILKEYNAPNEATSKAVTYILGLQSENGSWHNSPYQTSLAVTAIYMGTKEPDLSVSTGDITFTPAAVTSLPADITVSAVIRNNGLTDVPQATVALYDGPVSEENKAGEQVFEFPGKSSVTASFTVTITDGNAHRFYISADPEGLVTESVKSNNTALKALYPETTCDFEILSSDISVFPDAADLLQTVTINSRITNKGTGDAFSVPVKYYADLPSGAYDITTALIDIPAGKTVEHQAAWKADRHGQNLNITVFADPDNAFAEISETNNKASALVTVNQSADPNLTISHEDITVTPSPAHEAGTATISAIVKNNGAADAANVQVNFYKENPEDNNNTLLGSHTLASVSAGESATTEFNWTDIAGTGHNTIFVHADPDNNINEIKEDDNSAFITLNILSLPDLVVSSNSISFTPAAPKQGDAVSIRVSVVNTGGQEVSDVKVTAYEGNTAIGTENIPLVSVDSPGTAWFSYDTTGKTGIHEIRIVADPGNAVSEQNEENNTASRNLGVQDTNLWLTERFISPNGDEIQDSTTFFFRLETPETVSIATTDPKGRIVRTVTGTEFENTTGGTADWDGLDDNGMAVADGQYKIQVLNENGNVLAGLPVIVDNNRSPLADAVGTEYLLQTNLTCMMPNTESMQWFPDESGIMVYVKEPDEDAPEYLTGLYTITLDGDMPFRAVPLEWSKGNGTVYYTYQDFSISPDGESVAVVLDRYDDSRPYSERHEQSQLWTLDRYGENMLLLDSFDVQQDKKVMYGNAHWSPDNSHIAYAVYDRNTNDYELSVIKADSTGKTVITSESSDFKNVKWSPDSLKLFYTENNRKIILAEPSGNKQDLFEADDYTDYFEWLGNDRIIAAKASYSSYYYNKDGFIWLADASGNGEHVKIIGSENLHENYNEVLELAISPDRKKFAFIDKSDWSVRLCDDTGKCDLAYDLSSSDWHNPVDNPDECDWRCSEWVYNCQMCQEDVDTCSFTCPTEDLDNLSNPFYSDWYVPIKNLEWSHNGTRLAFIEGDYASYGCNNGSIPPSADYYGGLTVLDTTSKEVFYGGKITSEEYYCGDKPYMSDISLKWFTDNTWILAGYKAVNSADSETVSLSRTGTPSPNSRYITYYEHIKQDSICYGRGTNNLWAMSSLLNLTADLRVVRDKSALVLKGTAADLNFAGYALEYADPETPDLWNPIMPPSDIPVVNDVLATWIPPGDGSFLIRLTVSDRAGNSKWEKKQVFWGLSSSITNISKSEELFSPDNDGTKDTVDLSYTVLKPVHLEFFVYDEDDMIVRTFAKDHTVPGNDRITWDGRDENGVTVPDGKYAIKVFDYEFFFEVDNTPPEAKIDLGSIRTEISEDSVAGPLHADLSGLAIDTNFKTWTVEYGLGDNPQEWNLYETGNSPLAEKDKYGNLIQDSSGNPVPDMLASFEDEDAGLFASGKKFRITAEDYAGNKSTAVTGFVEEKLVLFRWMTPGDKWHRIDFSTQGIIPGAYVKPGIHSMQGLYTIRMPVAGAILQYRVDTEWFDAPESADTVSGMISLAWDNSDLTEKVNALRIKVTDLAGEEHFSNAVSVINPLHIFYDCEEQSYMGQALTLEELTLLNVQVGTGDTGKWTDEITYTAGSIPEGSFEIWETGHMPEFNRGDQIRLTGTGESGTLYEGNIVTHPPKCGGLNLEVNYLESGDCDTLSDRAELKAVSEGPPGQLKSLDYYIKEAGEFQLVQSLETWDTAEIDISDMPDGTYPVKAVLEYYRDNVIRKTEASAMLTVDHVLPLAEITFPGPSAHICPKWIQDAEGGGQEDGWYGTDVEGIATDNTRVKEYRLFYGMGENPLSWQPASTLVTGQPEHITGEGENQGQIGTFDITGMGSNTLSLMLRVTDQAGNVSCGFTSFAADTMTNLTLQSDNRLVSPNNDSEYDSAEISFSVTEYAVASVSVFKDSALVKTLASDLTLPGTAESVTWDGTDNSGATVPDGIYQVIASAEDSCGNTVEKRIDLTSDTTQPETVITYPVADDPIGVVVEIRGNAHDPNFLNYTLEAVKQGDTSEPVVINAWDNPLQDSILGKWNTAGLEGVWILNLSAEDKAGNTGQTSVTLNLDERQNLITDLEPVPGIFSPGTDGKLDITEIRYELNQASDVFIEILADNVLKKTYSESSVMPGPHSYSWDGTDNQGITVSDGAYTVRLTATLSSDTAFTHTENVTVGVDTTRPGVNIQEPAEQAFLKQSLTVKGSVSDANLAEYTVTCTGDSGTVTVDTASQDRENYIFGTLNPDEGTYTLTILASDLGENTTEKTLEFTIDRTLPKLTLESPLQGQAYGAGQDTVVIRGTIEEKNLQTYTIRYGLGTNPDQWTELATGNSLPENPELFTWKTGKNDGIPDGLYTLSLSAADKAGQEAEIRTQVIVDNTAPLAEITYPEAGEYLKAFSGVNITGTVDDPNLDKYTVEISEGECSAAFRWTPIRTSDKPVTDGVIAGLGIQLADGNYCTRITALDRSGNRTEIKHGFRTDTHPPSPPVLSGETENKISAKLRWTQNSEPDLAGYNLFRNDQKINADIITGTDYTDADLGEGIYAYYVKAVDYAGWESKASGELRLVIDITGPDAIIVSPADRSIVSGVADIKGTAGSSDDFRQYRVYIGTGQNPSDWNLVRTSPVPTSYDTLARWDTLGLAEDEYTIRLEAEDISGNVRVRTITVTVDNTPPAAPGLISAVSSDTDADITWHPNTENDLAGYLIFRNSSLANVSGTVAGSLAPYLVTGTAYKDEGLPDGLFTYYLSAMDKAGNVSGPSVAKDVLIDTHAPRAYIAVPEHGRLFDNTLMIRADSPDLDIAEIQFQYKKAAGSIWTDIGDPVTSQPFAVHLSPADYGLAYGDYDLRATATDAGGKTDASPGLITVTYTDLTAPGIPTDLKVSVTDGSAVLTWTLNEESDLEGYNIYMVSEGSDTKLNTEIITGNTWNHHGTLNDPQAPLADGEYKYVITASDTDNNESKPSEPVTATVRTPVIAQHYTPLTEPGIWIEGTNANAGTSVEIFADTGAGMESRGTASADEQGGFAFELTLDPGENSIAAKTSDSQGNTSRLSDIMVVAYNLTPGVPTGLAGSVNGYDASLSWNLIDEPDVDEPGVDEPDIAGYCLYRNGEKVNPPGPVTSGTANASSSSYNRVPGNAFDGDPSTFWASGSDKEFSPVWWEIAFDSRELVSRMEIIWDANESSGLSAGRDFEILVWSGHAWVTRVKVTGNDSNISTFDFSSGFISGYAADRIRIHITDTTNTGFYKYVKITDLVVIKENLIPEISYEDINLSDGEYMYSVSATDKYGFESLRSDEISLIAGDVVPPGQPRDIVASVSGTGIVLGWSGNTEPDLAGYNLYRNTGQEWTRVNSSLLAEAAYTDADLLNGVYDYRVTAEDTAGNESLPSSEASASVFSEPPAQPENPVAVPADEGMALEICWEYTGVAAGFNLYRSETQGGPYEKVNANPVTLKCYTDKELDNGVAYYYVVAASDAVGNESGYSVETGTTPADIVPPPAPVLLVPTAGRIPFASDSEKTDIAGLAEPGSQVRLFQNGSYIRKTAAQDQDTIQTYYTGTGISEVSVSADGNWFAYVKSNYLWRKQFGAGYVIRMAWKGITPEWSPDSRKLVYGKASDNRIYIYDMSTGSASYMTDDAGASESYPSWSRDSGKVVFVSNREGSDDIWIRDIVSGTASQVTSGADAEKPRFSPDSSRISWLENGVLFVTGTDGGDSVQISENVSMHAWSPVTGKLGFIKTADGSSDSPGIFAWDPDTENITGIISGNIELFGWSPGGNHIVYAEKADTGTDIRVAPVMSGQGNRLLEHLETANPAYLDWVLSGEIFFLDQTVLYNVRPKGYFEFADVWLNPGENIFSAEAADLSENISSLSEEITVTLSPDLLPNLAVSEEDILVFPLSPAVGEEAGISIAIRNNSPVEVNDAVADIYIWDAKGEIEHTLSETIQYIGPYSENVISFAWDTSGKPGENTVMVYLDPGDSIREASEADNFAARSFFAVSDQGEISVEAVTDHDWYYGEEDVNISISLFNSGQERDVILEVSVTDEAGETEAILDIVSTNISYGLSDFSIKWNTGYTEPGEYSVRAVLKDSGGIIGEDAAPLTIAAGLRVESSVTTDRSIYGPNRDVMMSLSVKNTGRTIYIPLLNARVRITDSSGTELFTGNRQIANLLSGSPVTLNWLWNTGLTIPGQYNVIAEIYYEGELAASDMKTFGISNTHIITGSIKAVPEIVSLGTGVQSEYTVTNTGNALADDVTVRVLVTDPETADVISSQETVVTIGTGETRSGEFVFPNNGFVPDTYHVVLQYEYQGTTKNLASAAFIVKDNTGPGITLVSPADNSTHYSDISLKIRVADNASGIGSAEYRIDDEEWLPLFAPDPSDRIYMSMYNPAGMEEGEHLLRFRAYDSKGNVSGIVLVTIFIRELSPFERLTGDLTAIPDPVYQGLEQVFEYIVANEAEESIDNIIVKVVITDPGTQEIIKTFETQAGIPAESNIEGSFTFSTGDTEAGIYEAVLLAEKDGETEPRNLDSINFEIAGSVEPNPELPGPVNLLAWVNDKCESDRDKHDECVKTDLLESILAGAASHYTIVYERDDFEKEMRNPFHTDFLIIGDHKKLTGHYDDELAERVNSGAGLVSSLSHDNWFRDPVLGVKFRGHLSRHYSVVRTVESPVSSEGIIHISEKADRIEALEGATTVGHIEREDGSHDTYPAIVLNEYGRGKTVYFAFDLGATLDHGNYDQIAGLIEKSVRHVHRAEETQAFPWLFVQSGVEITSRGDFDVRVTETFPGQLSLFDPGTGEWVTESPGVTDILTEQDETEILRYYYLMPDIPGTYATETEIGITGNGEYISLKRLPREITVEKNRLTLISDVIAELESLDVSGKDRSEIRKAVKELEDVLERDIDKVKDTEKNIHDLIKAAESLADVEDTDVTDIRLMTDILIRIEESMYYYWET